MRRSSTPPPHRLRAANSGRMGGSLPASVVENAIMTHHRLNDTLVRWGGLLLDRRAARRFTDRLAERFFAPSASRRARRRCVRSPAATDEGDPGPRAAALTAPLILLDQPTARAGCQLDRNICTDQMLAIRDTAHALLLISANLEELFLLADRIVVLSRGAIVADVPVEQASIEQIGRYMLERERRRHISLGTASSPRRQGHKGAQEKLEMGKGISLLLALCRFVRSSLCGSA